MIDHDCRPISLQRWFSGFADDSSGDWVRPFHVYLLRCNDGSYYCGHTDNLPARLQQHETSDVGYTATRKPVVLVWQAEFGKREEALTIERRIKGWSRAKKEALIAGDWKEISLLAKSHSGTPVKEPALRQAQGERFGMENLTDEDRLLVSEGTCPSTGSGRTV